MAWWKRKKAARREELSAKTDVVLAPPRRKAGLLKNLRSRLAQWRQRPAKKSDNSESQAQETVERQTDVLFAHDEDLIAFGLSWELLEKGQKQKLQAQALAQGHTHHVVSIESEQIGFLKLAKGPREKRPIYSAALLLSETVSLGGDEVFVFRLDDARFVLVALKNSMPVPGFDLIGSAATITKAASDYLSLPHKHEVRRCGDAEILSGAETFDFAIPLESMDRSLPRLKTIPDVRKMLFQAAVLAGLLLSLVIGWAGWSYFEAQDEAERLQRESDPNVLYEQNFLNSAGSIKGLGTSGIKAMAATLARIPLEVGGWSLMSIACQATECVATWSRNYGNYADFDDNLPPDVKQKPEYGFIAADAKNTQLKTRHPVTSEATVTAKGLKREALPLLATVQSEFVSRLQDYTLIEARVQVLPPTPFPSGVADIGPIFKPVVSGTWSMELPLWTIDSVTVPDYVLVESLTLDLGSSSTSQAESGKTAKHYKLTGKYYAKGKVF